MPVVQVITETQMENVIALSTEYVIWMVDEIKNTYPEVDTTPFLEAHDYDDIRSRFTQLYSPPYGRLFLGLQDESICGCIALTKWTETICEIQTLFVRPACRGQGIARELVKTAIQSAHEIGYNAVRLDTLAFMTGAQSLYKSFGFEMIPPYRGGAGDIDKHIRFYELTLDTTG